MMKKVLMLRLLLVLSLTLIEAAVLQAVGQGRQAGSGSQQAGAAQQKTATDVRGTWSGTFQSNSNLPPFTMTIVIDRDAQGQLVAKSSHSSNCFKESTLQVTVKGAQVVLAGSDDEGNSVTLRGKIDASGTLLALKYIINGGASGRCESDTGTGSMGKR